MVALIPAGDKRLKPRRTKLYLSITAILSAVVIALVAFFLWRLGDDMHYPFITPGLGLVVG